MRTIRTAKKRTAILEAIVECGGNVTRACAQIKLGRTALYGWLGEDKGFKKAVDDAIDQGMDVLEDEARRRGFDGVERPMMHGGKQVKIGRVPQVIREYSDTLLIFLLKGGRPKKYKDRIHHTGAVNLPAARLTGEQLDKRIAQLLEKAQAREAKAKPKPKKEAHGARRRRARP